MHLAQGIGVASLCAGLSSEGCGADTPAFKLEDDHRHDQVASPPPTKHEPEEKCFKMDDGIRNLSTLVELEEMMELMNNQGR